VYKLKQLAYFFSLEEYHSQELSWNRFRDFGCLSFYDDEMGRVTAVETYFWVQKNENIPNSRNGSKSVHPS